MRRFWSDVTAPLLRQRGMKRVVEIGSQSGESTLRLLELCAELGARADIIDPLPPRNEAKLQNLLRSHGTLHQTLSLTALSQIPLADVYLIDGDHNWYTVFYELKAIDDRVLGGRPPLMILHDVGWPYARRDLYYDPLTIPEPHRNRWKVGGLRKGEDQCIDQDGFNCHLAHAQVEGGERNGVLTAVEDFLAERPTYQWFTLPLWHGLGFLVAKSELDESYAQAVAELCSGNPALLSMVDQVEDERVRGLVERAHLQRVVHTLRQTVDHSKRRIHQQNEEIKAQRGELASLKRHLDNIETSRGYRALGHLRAARKTLSELFSPTPRSQG